MKATNIQWDVDRKKGLKFLPKEIDIPDDIAYNENGDVDEEAISDYLSDETGFCHYGFEIG